MNSSAKISFNKFFSHIYVEPEARQYEITHQILSRFPNSNVIDITHYKDIFNRQGQDYTLQKQAPALILAVNHGKHIYPGAIVCQSFGNDNFYYSSDIMNCIYDCQYCYLQGMYPSANIVIFVNIEDTFAEVEAHLSTHPMYICISYDTDLLALNGICGFADRWIDFANSHDNLTLELRTKSAFMLPSIAKPNSNIIFAWTLSPSEIIDAYEQSTPSLAMRLRAIKNACDMGYRVRLCFDPMIYIDNYEAIYSSMFAQVFSVLDSERIPDVSLGMFRISADYIKNLRNKRITAISAYPYTNTNGVCSYSKELSDRMLNFALKELRQYLPEGRIFTT